MTRLIASWDASPAAENLSGKLGFNAAIAFVALSVVTLGIVLVNPPSLFQFAYFFLLWSCLILVLNREDLPDFTFAFLVNSAFIAIYVYVQATTYPDTYGTTSPDSYSWTDDSYFFTLAADRFPPDLLSRPCYWEYSHVFASLVRWATPLPIEHPLDVLFFQSGTAAMLATFTGRFMRQLSNDRQLGRTAYLFTLLCPFLMMNGGIIFLRDTLAAALLIFSLSSLHDRRYLVAASAVGLQIALRPGTGILLLPVYAIVYFQEIRSFVGRHPVPAAGTAVVLALGAAIGAPYALEWLAATYHVDSIGFLGREVIADLTADPNANALFLTIQDQPFFVRLFLNGAYIFLYPFFTLRTVLEADQFDIRNVLLSVVVPIYTIWLNAWFVAGATSGKAYVDRQRAVVVALVVALMLIGVYSLQTRHKTLIYPLYYLIVTIGFARATPMARRFGYVVAGLFFLIQIAANLR